VNTSTSNKSNLTTYSIKESEKESRVSHETASDDAGRRDSGKGKAPAFGAGNALLFIPATGKDALKRRKPKTNIVKSSSSFVSRVIPHEAMSKRLQERSPDGLFAFANVNRAFQWLDLTSNTTFKVCRLRVVLDNYSRSCQAEHLTKILFTKAHMLCHDVNHLTKSTTHMDLVMGSSAADIIWYEPFSQKYARINKNVSPSSI
jgi:hypothetical protein